MTDRDPGTVVNGFTFGGQYPCPLAQRTEAFGVREQGGHMSKRVERLTSPSEVEEAFVELFDQIDRRVNRYIGSTDNMLLKKQALVNAVGMLEILKVMYQKDLHLNAR
jgi:hypothetical protein